MYNAIIVRLLSTKVIPALQLNQLVKPKKQGIGLKNQCSYLLLMPSKKFLLMFSIMFVLNLVDIHSTYFATPTLDSEQNFWIVKFGRSWAILLPVLFAYLFIQAALLLYHTDYFKTPLYQYRKSNGILDILKTYFFYDPREKNTKFRLLNSAKGILNYLGYWSFWSYVIIKSYVSIYNYYGGILRQHSKIIGVTNSVETIDVNVNDPFFESFFGKMLMGIVKIPGDQKAIAEKLFFQAADLAIPISFIIITISMARKVKIDSDSFHSGFAKEVID